MTERATNIVNELGMHARPAAALVKLAATFKSEIWIARDRIEVNAKSIMGVLTLAAEHGSEVRVRADGADEDAAVDAIIDLIAKGFGES